VFFYSNFHTPGPRRIRFPRAANETGVGVQWQMQIFDQAFVISRKR